MSTEQRLGTPVPPATVTHPSGAITLVGKHVTVTGIKAEHADALFAQLGGEEHAALWDYMMSGSRLSLDEFRAELAREETSRDPTYFTILAAAASPASTTTTTTTTSGEEEEKSKDEKVEEEKRRGERVPVGKCSLFRVDLEHRVVEVGSVIYGTGLARSTAATEAMYLLARHVFEDLGFRRYEWKANVLNKRSDRAARRLGFRYEGTFRQHRIVKGRNRDSAWYSMLDREWPRRKAELEAWLSDDNFDGQRNQVKRLEDFREEEEED